MFVCPTENSDPQAATVFSEPRAVCQVPSNDGHPCQGTVCQVCGQCNRAGHHVGAA